MICGKTVGKDWTGSDWSISYQTLLTQQAEEHGVAHLPQVLEAHRLQLCILHYVFQLVVEELQDTCQVGRNTGKDVTGETV